MITPPPDTVLISRPDRRQQRFRVHVAKGGRPLCGGGRLARLVTGWQQEIGEATCARCLAIAKKGEPCK